MPSLSVGSSVFGRFGRRHATELPPQRIADRIEESSQEAAPQTVNGTSHRRDSSILSLASSVSDLGHNVKRSVSLRSHRTQPSGGSNPPAFHTALSSTGTTRFSPPIAGEGETHATPDTPPRLRTAFSSSARSLSNKFASTEALSSLGQSERSDVLSPSAQSGAGYFGPMLPRRLPSERPMVQSHSSFSKDAASSQTSNGAPPDSMAPSSAALGSFNPRLVHAQIHRTSAKRIATIDYIRKVHEGKVYYFGTLNYTPAQLAALPSLQPVRMSRRANNYMVLGYSLPSVLEMNSTTAAEYLRALVALLQEFETYQTLSGFDSSGSSLSRGRVGAMFSSMGLGGRAGKSRRSSAAALDFSAPTPGEHPGLSRSATEATSPHETMSPVSPTGHDFTHLMTPHLPFDPDFHTTLATLCDVLAETYTKLLDLVPSPEQCPFGVGDTFAKADKMIRKLLVANVVREFEDCTRSTVKGEVAGLGRLMLSGLM